jgi:hypothetical protein
MSLLQNSNAISAGGYDINNSLRFRSSASAYLSRTPTVAGNRTTWTWSGWVKRGSLSSDYRTLFAAGASGSARTIFLFDNGFSSSSDNLLFIWNTGTNGYGAYTTAVLRDPSAWYHIVLSVDTTQATAVNRIKIYVNGTQQTTNPNPTYGYIAQNSNLDVNNTTPHTICSNPPYAINSLHDGYLAEVNFVDGQVLTPSSFGETDAVTGSWVAKKYTGTYGNNGFYLPFNHTETNENLLTYSEQFDNAAWTKVNFTATANSIASPLGSVVADRILETTANSLHVVLPTASPAIIPTLVYTFSTYVKSINNQYVQLVFDDTTTTNGGYANFDLTAGTVTQSANYGVATNIGATITAVGSGWYRISISTKIVNGVAGRFAINGAFNGTTSAFPSYTGNASNGYYVWGAQVNYGSTVNDYILTTASTVNQRGTTENSFTYSQDFTNAAWTKNASTITANTTTSPDGSTTASKLVENATLDGHQIFRSFTESNTTRTVSIYAKLADASRPYVFIALSDFVAYECRGIFNLSNGTVSSTSAANANYTSISTSITSVGNGWYRCTLTATKGAVNPGNNVIIGMGDATGNTYYTGSGTTLGIFIWGAQFEETSSVGPYWPTVASAQSKVFRIGADKSLGATGFGYDSWIPNNISLTYGTTYDAMTDSPTLTSATVSNYAVWNPLLPINSSSEATNVLDGNLQLKGYNAAYNTWAVGTIEVSSGKWYYEFTNNNAADWQRIGIISTSGKLNPNDASAYYMYYSLNGNKISTGGTSSAYGAAWTTGDIIGCALDLTNGKIFFSKNGVWQASGDPVAGTNAAYTGLTGAFAPASLIGSAVANSAFANFGQRPFSYTPPTGFVRLNTYNLPDSTIKKGNAVMDSTLYTGNGANRSITNASSFRPDFVWGQARSAAYGSWLFDAVRGATKQIESFSGNAESTQATMLTAFNSDGFSMGTDTAGNNSGVTYVAWQWQAGSSTVTNTSGSISSQVRANATTGFSIVTYTGTGSTATIGHGLGVAPKMMMIKKRNGASSVGVYHASRGNTGALFLNGQDAFTTAAYFNNTSPTPSVFTAAGGVSWCNDTSSSTHVAYCWAEINGFSKFGSYTGNGSTDGPFVHLGFRPEFVMWKRTNGLENWYIADTSRSPFNVADDVLSPNLSAAEQTSSARNIDFLSNGFKQRTADSSNNGSGDTYIYAAFAENPFKNANAR